MEVVEIFKNEMEKSVRLKATEEEYKQYLEIMRLCRFEIDKNLQDAWDLEEEDIRSELYDQAYAEAYDNAAEEVDNKLSNEIDDLRCEISDTREILTVKNNKIENLTKAMAELETHLPKYEYYEAELASWKLKVEELENAIDTMEI
jgi:chromosome segregation ATPase